MVACICAFIHGASRPALSFLFGAIIGTVGSQPADFMDQVRFVSISMVVLSAVVLVVATAWYYLFTKIAACLCQRVQRAYLAAVLSQDISWFDRCSPAQIPTKLSADIDKVQSAVASKAGNFMSSLSQAICGIVLGLYKGWIIGLVCCGAIPVLIISRMLMAKSMKAHASASQSLYAKAGAVAEEVLMAIRTVASFGGEQKECTRYNALLWEGRTKGVKVAIKSGLMIALVLSSMFAVYGLALYIGGILIEREIVNSTTGQIYDGGDIYVVLTSVVMSAFALGSLSPSLQAFSEGTAALEGLYTTIESKSTIEPSLADKGGSALTEDTRTVESIEIAKVTFRYPTRPEVVTLDQLSLTIAAGQRVALVGESGSGKSTIIQLLERFYDPESGAILINHENVQTMDPIRLRSLFGYVGQEPVLFATSIRENLKYGLQTDADDETIFQALKRANAFDFVMSLPDQLETYCGPGGSQMSGGQKQRLAIARALLRKPQVLLLDEATSALDNESEKQVQATIDQLQGHSSGSSTLTTISVAHRLSTVRNCDVIFVLQRGVLVEQGSHAELMKRGGVYKALVASQESTTPLTSPSVHAVLNASAATEPPAAGPVLTSSKSVPDVIKSEEQKEKERIALIAKSYKVPWKRLLSFTDKSMTGVYAGGILGAAGKGASFPIHAILFSSVVSWYYFPDTSVMMHKVSIAALEYIGLAVGVFIAVFVNFWAFAHIGESFTLRIRADCFKHILSQDMAFFDKPDNAPAKLLMSLSSWASKMHVLAGEAVGVFVEFFAALIAGLTMAFVASPKLAGVLVGTLPLLVLAMVMMSRLMWRGTRDDLSSRQAALVASEAVQNMRTVRALTAERNVLELYSKFSSQRVDEEKRKSTKTSLLFGASMMVAFLPYALGFYVGGLYVESQTLSMSDMMRVLLGLVLTSVGAGQALAFLPDIKAAKSASHDIFKLLDEPSKVNPFDSSHADVIIRGGGHIEFNNVSFSYPQRPERPVLRNLSFTVKAGLKVALVGPSGSGKSSIMALLQRFYDPQQGSLFLGGTDVKEMNVSALRGVMGYVGQEPVLFDCSMRDNVLYGNCGADDTSLESVKTQAKLDFVRDDNVHWDTVLGPKGGLLSGGQKQRTAIARALIRNPKILLLDEATSALDSASEQVVQKAIDAATVGRTTFVIAHRLSTIRDSDLILVIAEGQVKESGTHEELMTKQGLYHQLYVKGNQ